MNKLLTLSETAEKAVMSSKPDLINGNVLKKQSLTQLKTLLLTVTKAQIRSQTVNQIILTNTVPTSNVDCVRGAKLSYTYPCYQNDIKVRIINLKALTLQFIHCTSVHIQNTSLACAQGSIFFALHVEKFTETMN